MKRSLQQGHRRIWMVLGIVLPLVFLAGLVLKQSVPLDRPAVMIEPAKE